VPASQLPPGMPVRARRINKGALYEMVTVVGCRAFSATLDSRTVEQSLIGRSLEIAKQVGVHFATITWAIDHTGATPIRLNATPDESELQYVWDEVVPALCEDLKQ